MKPSVQKLGWLLLLVFSVAVLGLTGCATSDPDNMSARPWNAPKSWEGGIPSGMLEGR